MAKKSGKDIQLSFEFDTSDQKVNFRTIMVQCRCGYSGGFRKADIVIEMTVPCPECGSILSIK